MQFKENEVWQLEKFKGIEMWQMRNVQVAVWQIGKSSKRMRHGIWEMFNWGELDR